jgi:hypothetical protein
MNSRLLLPSLVTLILSSAAMSVNAAEPRLDFLGDPAIASAATRTIVIPPTARWVNVTGGDVVNFIVGDKSFAWAFNVAASVSSFDLMRVAPPGVLDHTVRAYIAPDPKYMGGGDRCGR